MRSIRTFRVAASFVVAGLWMGGAEFLDAQSLSEHTREVPTSVVRATVTQDLIDQRAQLERLIAARNWDPARLARTLAALDRLIEGDGLWVPQRAKRTSEAPSGSVADECEFEGLPEPCATEAEVDEAIEVLEGLEEEVSFLVDEYEAEWALFCADYPASCVENENSCADASESTSSLVENRESRAPKNCFAEAGVAVATTAYTLSLVASDVIALRAGTQIAAAALGPKVAGAIAMVALSYFTVELARQCFARPH